MKHIVFFTPSLDIGGVERVLITYAEALIRLGYDVSYLICHEGGYLSSSVSRNIKIISLGDVKLRNAVIPLILFLKKNPVDVLITGGDVPNALSVFVSKIACIHTKIIISHHNYFNIERSTLLSKLLFRLFYNKAAKIISVSDGITKMLLDGGVVGSKIATIYNPIDFNGIRDCGNLELKIKLPLKFLLFIGRLGEVKNLPFLVDSYKLIEQKDPSMELIFVGEGPERKRLEKMAQELGLTNKIHILGALSNPFPVIKRASAVILPSFSEALPTIILESFAFGKTVIATPTNGALDLLENGRLGYISNSFDNVEDFASTIEKGLLSPISGDLLESKVKKFNIDLKVKELEDLLKNI